MTSEPEFTSDVRVVHFTNQIEEGPSRTHWQTRRDEDLNQILEALKTSLELLEDGLEGLNLYQTPVHPNLPVYLRQLIAQVEEYRRLAL